MDPLNFMITEGKAKLEDEELSRIADELFEKIKSLSQPDHNELLTKEELAEYLKVQSGWVDQKVHEGIIPYCKVGKYPRFRKSEIDQWLEERHNGNGKTGRSR